MMKKLLTVLLYLIMTASYSGYGQDIQFSQIYANSMYQNPAFAGSSHATRLILHQRLQWPAIDAKYTTSFFSADSYFDKSRLGVGIIAFKDWQGSRNINSSDLSGIVAYQLPLSPELSVRVGLQGSYISRAINYNVLTFPDQYTSRGFTNTATGEEFGSERINLFSVSSGTVLYSDNFWFGVSSHHMNQPAQSFYGEDSRLPMKLSFTSGYRISVINRKNAKGEVKESFTLTPTGHYKMQGKADQLDLGLYTIYNYLITGFWYRGIPVKKYNRNLHNNESIVLLAGLRYNMLSFTYSYDFTVSKLVAARTGGSHEINITYLVDWPKKKRKPMKRLPCPDFYK
ncbi:MAG: type IX secretion system membrane protein PorP/SprF [Cytophagaceae bacterium]